MSQPFDEREFGERLARTGCRTAFSKSGRLLRIDNRDCKLSLEAATLDGIVNCDALRELTLCAVTGWLNDNVAVIAGLKNLRSLDVEGSDLNDQSLAVLADCGNLQVLNVRTTQVSRAQVTEIRKRMIQTRIIG